MKTENNGTGSEKFGEGESEVGRPEIRHLRRPFRSERHCHQEASWPMLCVVSAVLQLAFVARRSTLCEAEVSHGVAKAA